jgi:predicted kinase
MVPESTLHFFCGKMAAGKSTLAVELAKDSNAILLIEDDWLSHLFPDEISDIQDYIRYGHRLKKILSGHVVSLLSHGVSVVLDFPANTKDQRNWFRAIYEQANASHVLHFVDVSNDICKRQLKERSRDKSKGSAFT